MKLAFILVEGSSKILGLDSLFAVQFTDSASTVSSVI